jgi:xanthine dehydrogenase YagT iron-sulfur-binding subunit
MEGFLLPEIQQQTLAIEKWMFATASSQALIEQDGFQCGYCTPGQIMSAVACIGTGKADSEASIREFMSGNLCRCAAYPNIVAAVRDAKTTMEKA